MSSHPQLPWHDDLRVIIAAFFQILAVILIVVGAWRAGPTFENLNFFAGAVMQVFVALLLLTRTLPRVLGR